jgi:hypothetical protein
MGYLSKILSAVGMASTIPFASPQTNALTRPIGGLEGTISTCAKGGVKLCQTNRTHYLWDGELYDDSGKKIILNKDGAPIASGRWSYRGLENTAYNCFKEGVKECYTNNTHYLLNKELFIQNPDGNLVKVSHPSEQPKDEAIKGADLSPKKGLEGDVIPFIPDAPAPSAQKQLLFGYDQNFLTSSAIAMSAGTFVYYMIMKAADVFPFANRVYNQALTNFVERQVLAQLALATAAAATATEPQSNLSNLPGGVVKIKKTTKPHSNSTEQLSSKEEKLKLPSPSR